MKIEDSESPSLMKIEEKMNSSLIENPRHNELLYEKMTEDK